MSWFSEDAGFYGPEYLVEYEEILPHERTLREVDFLVEALGLNNDSKILDVPCGHGRHIVELSSRGFSCFGVDLNQFFLDKTKESAGNAGVQIDLLQCDMRKLDFKGEFDVALNLFTSMGFFESDGDDIQFLAGVFNSLRKGGVFLVDFANRSWLTKRMKQKDWRIFPGGNVLLVERKFDEISGRKIEYRTKIEKGVLGPTTCISQRMYTASELISMAKGVGFSLVDSYGDFAGNPLSADSSRSILCFSK